MSVVHDFPHFRITFRVLTLSAQRVFVPRSKNRHSRRRAIGWMDSRQHGSRRTLLGRTRVYSNVVYTNHTAVSSIHVFTDRKIPKWVATARANPPSQIEVLRWLKYANPKLFVPFESALDGTDALDVRAFTVHSTSISISHIWPKAYGRSPRTQHTLPHTHITSRIVSFICGRKKHRNKRQTSTECIFLAQIHETRTQTVFRSSSLMYVLRLVLLSTLLRYFRLGATEFTVVASGFPFYFVYLLILHESYFIRKRMHVRCLDFDAPLSCSVERSCVCVGVCVSALEWAPSFIFGKALFFASPSQFAYGLFITRIYCSQYLCYCCCWECGFPVPNSFKYTWAPAPPRGASYGISILRYGSRWLLSGCLKQYTTL